MPKLFNGCPCGCLSNISATDIILPEGAVWECNQCTQMFSSCTREQFEEAVDHWNHRNGLIPSDRVLKRMAHRRTRDYNIFTDILDRKSGIRLLDVGCSDGLTVEFYNSIGISAEGVDPSREAVEIGNSRGLTLHAGYLEDVAFPDNSFDVLTMYEVIEHLPDPVAMLTECRRILKPGGVLVVGTGNADSWTRRFKKEKWDFFGLYSRGGHVSFFNPRSLSVLGEKTGFRMRDVRTYTVKLYEKSEVIWPIYRLAKFASESISFLARIFNKGHQMEAFLVAV